MYPTVIIVNGFPRAGKDTFCEFAEKKYDTVNYSTVDTVKDVAKMLGWNGEKTPENRDMLSALKDFYTEWFDGPFKEIQDEIIGSIEWNDNKYHNKLYDEMIDFVFIHCREPKEIRRTLEWCKENGVECYCICIVRETMKGGLGDITNHADNNVLNMTYDMYLFNNGTLEEYKEHVLNFLDNVVSGEFNKLVNGYGS